MSRCLEKSNEICLKFLLRAFLKKTFNVFLANVNYIIMGFIMNIFIFNHFASLLSYRIPLTSGDPVLQLACGFSACLFGESMSSLGVTYRNIGCGLLTEAWVAYQWLLH